MVVLGVSAAQQTNAPGPLPGRETLNITLAKAISGDPFAEYSVGFHYLFGPDGGTNYVKALKWLTKSASHGNDQAQEMLGNFYKNAWGGVVDKDNNKAAYWFLRAAKQANGRKQIDIGWMYYNGEGVIQDYVEAYKPG